MQVYILEKWAWHQNQSDICSTALLRQTIQAPLTVPSKNTAPLKKQREQREGGGKEKAKQNEIKNMGDLFWWKKKKEINSKINCNEHPNLSIFKLQMGYYEVITGNHTSK